MLGFKRLALSRFLTPEPMKPFQLSIYLKTGLLALGLVTAGALPVAHATDGIYYQFGLDLGYAGRIGYSGGTTPHWAIYTYGGGTSSAPFTALDISAPSLVSGFQVDGNIALAGAYSRLSVSGYGSTSGDRYEHTTSTEVVADHGVIGGSRFSSTSINSLLSGGVTSLQNVSVQAAALTKTAGSPTNLDIGSGTNQVFSNTAFGGKYVMQLSNFVLGGRSTLTLNGAAGSAFVLNISGNFNIGGASQILLTGGLTPSDVLFNVTGNNAGQTGALAFEIGGDSVFNGTLLAYNSAAKGVQRSLRISGHNTSVTGELIANQVVVSSGAKVKHPKKKSEE